MFTLIFAKYWKQLAWGGCVFLVLLFAYLKGYNDCKRRYDADYNERIANYIKTRDLTDRTKDRILRDRQANPDNDSRDSCLLSNNPFKVKCVQ